MEDQQFKQAKHFFIEATNNLQNKNYLEAKKNFENSLKFYPDRVSTLINYSATLIKLKEFSQALAVCDQVTNIEGDVYENLINYGEIYSGLNQYPQAIEKNLKALALDSSGNEAKFNLASLYKKTNDKSKAAYFYQKLIEQSPEHDDGKFNYALFLLGNNEFEKGWDLYSHRWNASNFNSKKTINENNLWQGDLNAEKKTILLWAEQGIGDEILYAGIYARLKIRSNIIISASKKLLDLFRISMPEHQFIERGEEYKYKYAEQLPIGDLGKLFRKNQNEFICTENKYLVTDKKYTHILDKYKVQNKKICGISWFSKNKEFGDSKSMHLVELMPILQNKNMIFINLQYGEVNEEIEKLNKTYGVKIEQVEDVDCYNDINKLASVIEACDHVVTVSNTTAHLAGALNKKTFMLLAKNDGSIWYWQNQKNNKSLWYPSIEIFQQTAENEWTGPVLEIENKINA